MTSLVLLDNDAGYLRSLETELRRAGIQVFSAACVPSALTLAVEQSADAIVVFERLALLDAVDLLELKKLKFETSAIPVAVVGTSSARKLECFRLGCQEFIELPRDEPEVLFRLHNMLRKPAATGLNALLSEVGLVDLVQMLSSAQRSGEALVETDSSSGLLYFEDGQIIHARFEEKQGEAALLALLRKTAAGLGRLSFHATELSSDVPRTIAKRTDHLLLALAGALDEAAA